MLRLLITLARISLLAIAAFHLGGSGLELIVPGFLSSDPPYPTRLEVLPRCAAWMRMLPSLLQSPLVWFRLV
jgi:hypothetical protein